RAILASSGSPPLSSSSLSFALANHSSAYFDDSFVGGLAPGKGAVVRIAVIGCGKQGRRHLAAFARLPAVDGLVVADADDTRTVAAACDNGAVAVPVDDVFADEIDAVVIATPTATHLSLARRAFESGMHVLCEKPFGADPVAARGLAADTAAKGLVGRVGYLYRVARQSCFLETSPREQRRRGPRTGVAHGRSGAVVFRSGPARRHGNRAAR